MWKEFRWKCLRVETHLHFDSKTTQLEENLTEQKGRGGRERGSYRESTGFGAAITGTASYPENVTSCINLHNEILRRGAQFHSRNI